VHLYLLRHAKSAWTDASLRDHDRPLAPRGERAATRMGIYLAGREPAPTLVLCSSARRAQQTLERILVRLGPQPEVRIDPEIYAAGSAQLLRRIAGVDPAVRSLLVLGHNPTLGDVAVHLAGSGDPAASKRMAAKFPTAALAELRFEAAGWDRIAPGEGVLVAFTTPRDLGPA
jgi:phosphohistidine phosphatase